MTFKNRLPGDESDNHPAILAPEKHPFLAELKKNYGLIIGLVLVGLYFYWDNLPRPLPTPTESAVSVMKIMPLPKKMADFTVNNANDEQLDLDSFYGRLRLIAFYRSECEECWPTLRALDDLNFIMQGKIDVIPVALRTFASQQRNQIQRNYGRENIETLKIFNIDQKVGQSFVGPEPLPVVFLLDKDGNVVALTSGPAGWQMPDVIDFLTPLVEDKYIFPKFRKK